MRIYLDCCCLNRPFDDLRQERIRIEAYALERIMGRVRAGDWILVGSDALSLEVSRIRRPSRREAVAELLAEATVWVAEGPELTELAKSLVREGVPGMDAVHLASATLGRADVLLTVDVGLYKRAARLDHPPIVPLEMPASWLEQLHEERTP